MPRPRKSAELHALTGAYDNHPKRARKDLKATGAIGPWRQRATDPATIWAELVAECPAGILTAADRVAMEYATNLVADMRSNPSGFGAAKGNALMTILSKLGCTPAARMGMAVPDPKDKHDPQEKYFVR